MHLSNIKTLLEKKTKAYNTPDYISSDPISIPHSFSQLQDIEIAAFFASTFAWGRRNIIIAKSRQLMTLMDNAPYDFIVNHEEKDRKKFTGFKHRTFQPTDTLYFLAFLQRYYRRHTSLESAFTTHLTKGINGVENALIGFHNLFFSLDFAPQRTKKHLPTPIRKSTCKRLNMFLRWMVRKDDNGVDFGLWTKISPAQLYIPMDVHVIRIATRLGLLERKQTDWKAVQELTAILRTFDPDDPAKYDYALFGMGVFE